MSEIEQDDTFHMPTRESSEAPSASNRENQVKLLLMKDIQATLHIEVGRLQTIVVTCKVLGKRMTRGEMWDLIQESLMIQIGWINDVQFLRRGFYLL